VLRPIPSDPALPALQETLVPQGAPEIVTRAVEDITGTTVDATKAELSYVRYRPTIGCTVLWSFHASSGAPLLVSGELFGNASDRDGPARYPHQRLTEHAGPANNRMGDSCRFIPERRLLVEVFPQDSGLPGLPLAACKTWAADVFARSLATPHVKLPTVEVISSSYKPRLRCVFRYTLEREAATERYFGKVFRDDRGELLMTTLPAVKARLLAADGPWDIASPVLYSPEARLLVLEAVDSPVEINALVRKALQHRSAWETLRRQMIKAAEGLAAFRQAAVDGLSHVGPRKALERIERTMEGLGLQRVAPSLAETIRRRLHMLETEACRLSPEKIGLSHGAFRHSQFVLSGESLVALDLDALCLSGANADPAEFLTGLDRMALYKPRLTSLLHECEQVFLGALHRQTDIDPRWLAWHRSAAHVKWALRSLFTLGPSWPESTAALLRLSERTLEAPR
jgi:hypothetical protein